LVRRLPPFRISQVPYVEHNFCIGPTNPLSWLAPNLKSANQLPSASLNSVAARNKLITMLNTYPSCTSTNTSLVKLPVQAHSSRLRRVDSSYLTETFTLYSTSDFPDALSDQQTPFKTNCTTSSGILVQYLMANVTLAFTYRR
jgi:hypothetical protein